MTHGFKKYFVFNNAQPIHQAERLTTPTNIPTEREIKMKFITIAPVLVVVLFTANAYAICEVGSKTVFSCMTAKGKQIEVCDAGKTIEYSFGKPKVKPEIVVKVPRKDVSTSQWDGMGRYISYSVNIPNGSTTYNVFWATDKLTEEHAVEAGVNVETNNKLLATVNCSGKNIKQNLEGIDLKAAE